MKVADVAAVLLDSKIKPQAKLVRWVEIAGLPAAVSDYPFLKQETGRRFEIDLAWPDLKAGVEVEGGVWSGGAHGRGWGIERDMEKSNLATLHGWRVLRVSTREASSGSCLGIIANLLGVPDPTTRWERTMRFARRTATEIRKVIKGRKGSGRENQKSSKCVTRPPGGRKQPGAVAGPRRKAPLR